jgi:hypothetical protein
VHWSAFARDVGSGVLNYVHCISPLPLHSRYYVQGETEYHLEVEKKWGARVCNAFFNENN